MVVGPGCIHERSSLNFWREQSLMIHRLFYVVLLLILPILLVSAGRRWSFLPEHRPLQSSRNWARSLGADRSDTAFSPARGGELPHFEPGKTLFAQEFGISPNHSADTNDRAFATLMKAIKQRSVAIHLPPGTISVSRHITVPQETNVEFVGQGADRTVLTMDYREFERNEPEATRDFISSKTDPDCNPCTDRIRVRDLALQMTHSTVNITGKAAIRIMNNGGLVENVLIKGWFSNAIIVNGSGKTSGKVWVSRNRCEEVAQYCVRAIDSPETRITENEISHSGTSGSITLQGDSHNSVVERNVLIDSAGIQLESVGSYSPNGSIIAKNIKIGGSFGIYYQHLVNGPSVRKVSITENRIEGISGGFAAIYLEDVVGSTISKNLISNSLPEPGIHLNGNVTPSQPALENVVMGNIIHHPNGDGIRITQGDKNYFIENQIGCSGGFGIDNLLPLGPQYLLKNLIQKSASGDFNSRTGLVDLSPGNGFKEDSCER